MGRLGKNKTAAASASTKPKGRPGPKGKFRGFRLEYMESIFPTYLEHVGKGTTTSYWAFAESGYWARFDWRNPDLTVEVDEDTFRNASVPPDKDGELSPEEVKQKAQVMVKTNKVRNFAARDSSSHTNNECSKSETGYRIIRTRVARPAYGRHGLTNSISPRPFPESQASLSSSWVTMTTSSKLIWSLTNAWRKRRHPPRCKWPYDAELRRTCLTPKTLKPSSDYAKRTRTHTMPLSLPLNTPVLNHCPRYLRGKNKSESSVRSRYISQKLICAVQCS